MRRSNIAQIAFFALVAIWLIIELFLTNLANLIGPTDVAAGRLGLSITAMYIRLVILILLNTITVLGVLRTLRGYIRRHAQNLGRTGVLITTIGLLIYGVYHFLSALIQIQTDARGPNMSFGIFYIILGVFAWVIGGDFREAEDTSSS